jgi:hypothetical protein
MAMGKLLKKGMQMAERYRGPVEVEEASPVVRGHTAPGRATVSVARPKARPAVAPIAPVRKPLPMVGKPAARMARLASMTTGKPRGRMK